MNSPWISVQSVSQLLTIQQLAQTSHDKQASKQARTTGQSPWLHAWQWGDHEAPGLLGAP
jgi:hypothetical protein